MMTTFAPVASSRMSLRVRNPSSTSRGRGGKPRSSVTIAGRSRRTISSAWARSLARKAATVVGDRDHDPAILLAAAEADRAAVAYGVVGVEQQVDHHFLDLLRIGRNFGNRLQILEDLRAQRAVQAL